MQVVKDRAELNPDVKDALNRKLPGPQAHKMLFQRLSFNKIHDEIGAPAICKLLVNAR